MNYTITKEQYLAAKAAWKLNKTPTAPELLTYNLLRGFPLERGFTPVTKPTKLANGLAKWGGFNTALHYASRNVYIGDSSLEYYLKKYEQPPKKVSLFSKLKGEVQHTLNTLPDHIERRRQIEITDNQQKRDRFLLIFGLELTEELASRLLEAMKDKEMK
jgi:hypothetical protein